MSRGAVFRWGAIGVGVALLCHSALEWARYDPLDERPEAVSVRTAGEYARLDRVRYVTMNAGLETGNRLYPTGMARPAYGSIPNDVLVALDGPNAPRAGKVGDYLGARVSVNASLDRGAVGTLPTIAIDETKAEETTGATGEKYIAPILGTGNRIFAMSPLINDDASGAEWTGRGRFVGRLSRMSDIEHNAHGIDQSPEEIADHLRRLGAPVSVYDSFVILTEYAEAPIAKNCLIPLSDSGRSLFVEAAPDDERQMLGAGVVTGLLHPRSSSDYAGIGDALNSAVPEQIGVITMETAADYNARQQAFVGLGFTLGVFLFGFGAGSTFLLHRLRKWNCSERGGAAGNSTGGKRPGAGHRQAGAKRNKGNDDDDWSIAA